MPSLVPMVIESTKNGERAMDIQSRLMRDRIILLDGEVSATSSSIICSQLLFLENENPDQDIQFFINSPGGSVTAGLAIYDLMNFIKCDVATYVMGQAASMGSFLASSGTKGKRFILPSATHMIHQPLGGARGQASDILIQANEIVRLKKFLTEVYQVNTGQPYDKLERDMDRDNFLTAKECIEYGLADQIITKRP